MDWVHCNDCYKLFHSNPGTRFVMTACTRIQCVDCSRVHSCHNKGCEICHTEDYVIVTLDDEAPSFVAEFFQDPFNHLKQFCKIHEFQRLQRERFLKHLSEETNKLERDVESTKEVLAELEANSTQLGKKKSDLLRELQGLLAENLNLKRQKAELELKHKQMDAEEAKARECRSELRSRRENEVNYEAPRDSVYHHASFNKRPIVLQNAGYGATTVTGVESNANCFGSNPPAPQWKSFNLKTPANFPGKSRPTPIFSFRFPTTKWSGGPFIRNTPSPQVSPNESVRSEPNSFPFARFRAPAPAGFGYVTPLNQMGPPYTPLPQRQPQPQRRPKTFSFRKD